MVWIRVLRDIRIGGQRQNLKIRCQSNGMKLILVFMTGDVARESERISQLSNIKRILFLIKRKVSHPVYIMPEIKNRMPNK